DENRKFEPDYFLVNGTVTPYREVEPTRYRLRILNGANARFFRLTFRLPDGTPTTKDWTVVGADGGLSAAPVTNPRTTTPVGPKEMVVLAPAERLDVVVDFGPYPAGTDVELSHLNPRGVYVGPVMQFRVRGAPPAGPVPRPEPPARSPRLAA